MVYTEHTSTYMAEHIFLLLYSLCSFGSKTLLDPLVSFGGAELPHMLAVGQRPAPQPAGLHQSWGPCRSGAVIVSFGKRVLGFLLQVHIPSFF